ncbi:MAG: hypothetical protein M0P31_15910 [Solirubrobacteraceae bacterium]|nr:hypothetical protein [Solirubrobacteraceae bacterium]
MLFEALVWTGLSAVVDSSTLRTVIAIGLGAALVFVLRDRIWGPDWRERIAAARRTSGR